MDTEGSTQEKHEIVRPVAVSSSEVSQFGCPYCGFRSGYSPIYGNGTAIVICGECGGSYAELAEDMTSSTIGFGDYYPELIDHPRRGIPSHGVSDKRPEEGGEYFTSRGVGTDTTPGCFVCGGNHGSYANIAAFVRTKEAGERVVAMFKFGARLDYRSSEPDRVQVKIGACKKHRANLEKLDRLTDLNRYIITEDIVKEATNA